MSNEAHNDHIVSREDIIAVAVRLFSIYVLFGILRSIPGAMQLLSTEGEMQWVGLYVIAWVVSASFCAFLWFFPLSVARKFLPAMREPRSEQAIGAPVALSLGLTLIGVWFFAAALVDATFWTALLVRSKQAGAMPVEWTNEQIANMTATAMQMFLSLWLIFGSAGIRRILYRFRFGDAGSTMNM